MKRFDPISIKNRILKRLQLQEDWALLVDSGAVDALLNVEAESLAEVARYLEYLYLEKKWTTAQNPSSLHSMASLIGKKPRRAVSAIGYVIVSHTDIEGNRRLSNLGRTFFNIDDVSDYDDIIKKPTSSLIKKSSLVPWTHDVPYTIPKGTRFISNTGAEFIAVESVSCRKLTEPYSLILQDPVKLNIFLNEGGWNGIKYVKVPVIQGIQRKAQITQVAGERFETFTLRSSKIEDGSNSISSHFLKVFVKPATNTDPNYDGEEWQILPSLVLAGPYDKVVEVRTSDDAQLTLFRFGNGVTGKIIPKNSIITIYYLETLGAAGNVNDKYQITTMIPPYPIKDPRTNSLTNFLDVTNIEPILGGQAIENLEDIRRTAPREYLKYYSITTPAAYEYQIKNFSNVGISKVRIFSKEDINNLTFNVDASKNNFLDYNLLTFLKNPIFITAISTNGDIIENADSVLIEPLKKVMLERKSISDTFFYIEPNFIKLKLNIKIKRKYDNIPEDEMKTMIQQALIDKYSIFNSDFKKPFYFSDYIYILKSFPFVENVNTFIEAIADNRFNDSTVSFKTIYKPDGSFVDVVDFKFYFDKIYGIMDLYKRGFKNYKEKNNTYLLKVELKFTQNADKASRLNRTLFLYDNRHLSKRPDLSINKSKYYSLDGLPITTVLENIEDMPTIVETNLENIENRGARVAQFPLINELTFDETMISQIKSYTRLPLEIRPVIIDGGTGKNKIFNIDDVPIELRYPSEGLPGGKTCYKLDTRYFQDIDIFFYENYDDVNNPDYARGIIRIPKSYFEINELFTDPDFTITNFIERIKNEFEIKVYAKPLITDLIPSNENDIIFCNLDDIGIEIN